MNKLNLKNKKQGFTIIEVVLVLAIAGLIFLIVFLALPGLQRSRRDTQRKSDVGRMIAAITSYQSNHGGKLPDNAAGKPFAASTGSAGTDAVIITSDQYVDPSGNVYTNVVGAFGVLPSDFLTNYGGIIYVSGFSCGATSGIPATGNALSYVHANQGTASVAVPLESGGVYCKDTGA